jgi:hypothetical protein
VAVRKVSSRTYHIERHVLGDCERPAPRVEARAGGRACCCWQGRVGFSMEAATVELNRAGSTRCMLDTSSDFIDFMRVVHRDDELVPVITVIFSFRRKR